MSSDFLPPAVSATKAATDLNGGDLVPGDTLEYTITVDNSGGLTANNVVLTDAIPANTTYVADSTTLDGGAVADAGGVMPFAAGGAIGMIDAGTSATVVFEVTVDNPLASGVTEIDNQGTVSGDNFVTVDTNTTTSPVTTNPALSLSKDDGDVSAAPGDTITYTLTYQNTGDVDLDGVTLSETVPDNTTFNDAASTVGWTCDPDNTAGSTCTFDLGTLAGGSGSTTTFAVDVASTIPTGVTQIDNSASISSGSVSADASDSTPLTGVAPSISVIKAATDLDGGSLLPGDTLEYTLTIDNSGNTPAVNVVLTDAIPANTTYVADSTTLDGGAVGDVGGIMPFAAGGVIGTMDAGTSATVVFQVTVDNPLASGVTEIDNQGTVSGDNFATVNSNTVQTAIVDKGKIIENPSSVPAHYFPDDEADVGYCAEGATICDAFVLVLDSAPTADVTVNLTVSDSSQIGLIVLPKGFTLQSSQSVVFSAGNVTPDPKIDARSWNNPVIFYVSAFDDGISKSPTDYSVSISATSADPRFDGVTVPDFPVTVYDAGVPVSPTAATITDGNSTTYTVVLSGPPGLTVVPPPEPETVTVALDASVSGGDSADVSVSPTTLTFNRSNWNIPQTVTVTTNGAATSPFTVTISHSVSSNIAASLLPQLDSDYGGSGVNVTASDYVLTVNQAVSSLRRPALNFQPNMPTEPPTIEPADANSNVIEAESDGVERSADWFVQDTSEASGGAYVVSGAPDSEMTIYFSGTDVTVIYAVGPGFGDFALELDGTVVQKVSSYADAFAFGQQVSLIGLVDSVHQLRVLPQGTSGLDAFVIGAVTATVEPTVAPTETATEVTPATTEEPIATAMPTETATEVTPATTEEPRSQTATPTETATEVTPATTEEPIATATPTETATEAPTLPPAPTDTPTTVLPIATLPPPMYTLEPLPLPIHETLPPRPFPTVELPTLAPAPSALTLPAVAPMADSFWEVIGSWSLTNAASEDGQSLGWLASNSPDPALLSWTQSVDLTGAQYPTLSLRTALQGAQASAVVQIQGNNGIWTMLAVIPSSEGWQTVSADLSAYAGQQIELRFAWLAAPVAGDQVWKLAQVVISDVPPTPTPEASATPTNPPTVVPTEAPAPTDTPTLLPTLLPTDTPTLLPTDTPTPLPTDTPQPPEPAVTEESS